MQSVKLLFCLIFILLTHATIAWLINQPQNAGPDVPSGKLRSLSFAPYHDGFSPIEQKFPEPEHIDADVRVVADKTYNIRTYSVRGGMQPTPEFARQHGVDMIMGGWLGDGHPENKIEIQTLIQAANQNQDVVKRVIVGNEVLLRKDMDIDTLIGYIRQVKQTVKQPVTYADVWSSYMQYPQLFNEVDFITIHILPYWEDEPVGIENAAKHVEKIVKQIQDKASSMGVNKPILIGESGWPAVGRQRGSAVPSVVNEARFIRELIQVADRQGFDYNIVEAFNQPWKSNSEGVVGANWGMLDINREPVFPLTGPVMEKPDWLLHFAWATALCLILVAFYFKRLQVLSTLRLVLFLSLTQTVSICLINLVDYLWQTSYSDWQRLYTVGMVMANTTLGILLMQRCYAVLSNSPSDEIWAKALDYTYRLFASLAVYKTYYLAINGRYLSFPVEQFAIPVVGILVLIACICLSKSRCNFADFNPTELMGSHLLNPYQRYLAYLLSFGVVAVVIGETNSFMSAYDFIQAHPDFSEGLPVALGYSLQNQQLVSWLFCILILSIPFWPSSRTKSAKA
jgi:exo-beta-1,3-glucanase (GH17 family)